jgi:hypothetical protein
MIIPQQQQQQQQLDVVRMYLRLAESPCVETSEGWSCPLPYCKGKNTGSSFVYFLWQHVNRKNQQNTDQRATLNQIY